jgi:phospholipid/cholesterol/gamma-HCH transport system substrate-binding protein
MKHKNSELFSELLVGVFVATVLVVLFYFTVIISGRELFTGRQRTFVNIKFMDVGGLKVRDSVRVRGVGVGEIANLKFEDGGVLVKVSLQSELVFKEGYKINVRSSSMLGGNHLVITEGKGAPLPKDTVLVAEPIADWMKDLGEVVGDIREVTAGGKLKTIVANLEATTESAKALASRLEAGKGTLGKLMSEDETLYKDLQIAATDIRNLANKLNSGTNSLGRLVNDDGIVYTDMKDAMNNLKSVSARLDKGEGTLGKLLSSDDTLYKDAMAAVANIKDVTERLQKGEGTLGKLTADNNKLYNDLDSAVNSFKVVADRLEKGEGTLGKLSKDEDLYKDVHGLIKDARQTVDNFRDTMPITAFTSLLTGAL